MEYRAARASERDEVLDLLAHWYGDRTFFALYNQKDPRFRDALCLVARDRERVVSTVQIFDRAVNLDGHAVPIGGIGSVFTLEEYRHRGVASALMRLALETMDREGFEVSLLFAERLTFYAMFGWESVTRLFSVLEAPSALDAGPFEIAPFDSARDLADVSAIYESYSGRVNVTAIRDALCWRGSLIYGGNNVPPQGPTGEYFVIARDHGSVAAYARAMSFHGFPMVMEYGYRDGAAASMLALFRHLGDVVSGGSGGNRDAAVLASRQPVSAPVLISHTAHDPALEQALASAGCPVRHHEDNFYMWRVISPERLGKRLAMAPEAAASRAMETFRSCDSLFWTADRF